jgi:rare lipoprotein A
VLKLGYAERGTTRVHLEAVMPPGYANETRALATGATVQVPPAGQGSRRYLQVGAFSDPGAARRLTSRLQEITALPVFVEEVVNESRQKLHRVRVGPIADNDEIRSITERVVAANLGSPYTVSD